MFLGTLANREQVERQEEEWLAPYAMKSRQSRGRFHKVRDNDPYRTCFQRDRGRIIHSTAFRRLQGKTQVFVNPAHHFIKGYAGDYHRTRLTHTNETAQVARVIAQALGLNQDLTEAIALAHDLGHPAFGHAGEDTLNRLMAEDRGRRFDHNVQSLRIVEKLERPYIILPGLNLTYEVREGLAKHTSRYDKSDEFIADYNPEERPTLEAQIIDLADEIAYTTADLDDALEAGLIGFPDLEREGGELWGEAKRKIGRHYEAEGGKYRAIGYIFNAMARDVIQATAERLAQLKPRSVEDIRQAKENLVAFSAQMRVKIDSLIDFLYQEVYWGPKVEEMYSRAEKIIEDLFNAFWANEELLPKQGKLNLDERLKEAKRRGCDVSREHIKRRLICDYIASLTDPQALAEHDRIVGLLGRK